MWRMRMRLLFGFLVLMAIGHLPQERGVVAQKYYMNFAFNNNNPDGVAGDDPGNAPPLTHDNPMLNGNAGNDGNVPIADNTNNQPINNEIGGPGGGGGGVGGDGGGEGNYQGTEAPILENHVENEMQNGNEPSQQPTGGNDDDNDDSDSKDAKNRRRKMADQGRQRTDHSHHSSYEISIDDSFGGRYVRSIYESSESHGHSGSRAGSNARDSGVRDSSQEGKANEEEHGDANDGTPVPGVVDGNVADGATDAAPGNNDYEEM